VVGPGVVFAVVVLAISVGHSQYGAVSYEVEQLSGGGREKHGFRTAMRPLASVRTFFFSGNPAARRHLPRYLDRREETHWKLG